MPFGGRGLRGHGQAPGLDAAFERALLRVGCPRAVGAEPVANASQLPRELEASVDFNNLTNNNVAWDARTLGGTINLRQNGDPTGAINTLPQFASPAQVYGPRNVRFNVAFRF